MQLGRLGGGNRIRRWLRKRRLRWLGDKKPVQHCDPDIRAFLKQHFPSAHYLHIVRDPATVVASMMAAANTWSAGVPDYWRLGPEQILQRWTIHEQWAIDAKEEGLPVHSLRFEDLVSDPQDSMHAIFDFLKLNSREANLTEELDRIETNPNRNYTHILENIPAATLSIMAKYGYAINHR